MSELADRAAAMGLLGGTLAAPYAPVPVDDLTLAFPAKVRHLMPPWREIPTEHQYQRSTWADFQHHWFAIGLPGAEFHLADAVDGNTAVRHLSAIQGSFEPKHEEKVAAVAFLASLWFTAVRLPAAESRPERVWGAMPAAPGR